MNESVWYFLAAAQGRAQKFNFDPFCGDTSCAPTPHSRSLLFLPRLPQALVFLPAALGWKELTFSTTVAPGLEFCAPDDYWGGGAPACPCRWSCKKKYPADWDLDLSRPGDLPAGVSAECL